MALTAYPTIVFNAGTGSDSAASGAGPTTAITGTCAASTNSTTVTFNGTPDLSGVATDGSHVLWVSGVGFVRISTVNVGSYTCTVETSLTITASAAFAIGGKRATLDEAESRRLFAATASPTASGATGQWTISLQDDQSISASITMAFTTGIGYLKIAGDSTSSRRTITQTGNATHLSMTVANRLQFENCVFRNSNVTKNEVFTSSSSTTVRFENCIIGASDGTNCPKSIGVRTASSYVLILFNTIAIRLTGTGTSLTSSQIELYGSEISRCGGNGITATTGSVTAVNSIISHNTGDGINFSSAPTKCWLLNNTIHANAGDGVDMAGSNNAVNVLIVNNQITSNTSYGLTMPGTSPHYPIVEYNNFGNASDSTNNTTSAVNGFSLPSSNTTIAPGYTDASSSVRNFAIASSAKATGFPSSAASIAAGQSGSTSYMDIGAVQRQESGGGLILSGMDGGFNG